jgi:hypothetical protein
MTLSMIEGGLMHDDPQDRSKLTVALAATVLFLAVLGTSVGLTASLKDSTAWSALPVGWVAVWVAAVVAITGYLAWAERHPGATA